MRNLKDKRVIITGASSGIGRELARQMAAEGSRLVINARREDRLVELADELAIGDRCAVVVGDVTDSAVRSQLLATAKEKFGGLDILVNNAGIGAMGRFDEASEDRLRQIFEVNFFAVAELIRECLPLLKSGNEAVIVNLNSVLGHRAVPLKSEYCASKFAIHGLSDALRAEFAADGIDMLLVSPSTTDSEFFDAAIDDPTKRDWKKGGAMSPEVVASRTVRAIKKRRHEIILTFGGRILVWLDRMIPGIANRIIAKFGQ
ncbi:SDR family NAD(P)-dependent oxidoreductase [Mariniblastus fucicola]|uniref:Putative oxidoreductase n=1 Tax=Mariniblastus fucicola TaxID=980251 RepID=A0A5B9PDA3_9BACT|nr:SDR family NAD(P)-dependent oxidoreductase [Mariniblastus fucicola]QEG23175.1 putative oxidoreductase [Mariniblastus fucicola]